jgi:hypothetical protein
MIHSPNSIILTGKQQAEFYYVFVLLLALPFIQLLLTFSLDVISPASYLGGA